MSKERSFKQLLNILKYFFLYDVSKLDNSYNKEYRGTTIEECMTGVNMILFFIKNTMHFKDILKGLICIWSWISLRNLQGI